MKKQAGFTLIELMITVAVLGIALAIAVPNMQQIIMNNRLTSMLNQMTTSLAYARSEAVKQNELVVVCVTANGTQCDNSDVPWTTGWIVFVDRNEDFNVDPGGGDGCAQGATDDCILTVQQPLEGSAALEAAADVTDFIAYDGQGAARCDGNSDGTLEDCDNADTYLVICDQRGAGYARAVAISKTGRSSILTEKPNGSALTCTP